MFDDKADRINKNKIDSYLLHQIKKNYRFQDERANREIDESHDYVTVEWLSSCFSHCCSSCGCTFSYEINEDNGVVTSNLTANRIDCSLPHYLNNVIPLCPSCNASLSNHEY